MEGLKQTKEPSLENSVALEEISDVVSKARIEFYRSKPDFSEIEECIKEMFEEIDGNEYDIKCVLLGKQIEKNMQFVKESIPKLKDLVEKATTMIDSNKTFEPYRGQVDAARKIVEALGKI